MVKMHEIQKLLLKADKKFNDLMTIFLKLSDEDAIGTEELKEISNKYVELLQKMKSQIQPQTTFDWDKYEEEHTATIDFDRLPSSQKESEPNPDAEIDDAFEIIRKEQKTIKVDDFIEKSGVDKELVEAWIEKKKRNGDIFEPRRGYIQKI